MYSVKSVCERTSRAVNIPSSLSIGSPARQVYPLITNRRKGKRKKGRQVVREIDFMASQTGMGSSNGEIDRWMDG